jgi:hypothetical protein
MQMRRSVIDLLVVVGVSFVIAGSSKPPLAAQGAETAEPFFGEMYTRFGGISDRIELANPSQSERVMYLLLPIKTERYGFVMGLMEAADGKRKTVQIRLIERAKVARIERGGSMLFLFRSGQPMIARLFINSECDGLREGIPMTVFESMIKEADERQWQPDP